MMKFAAGIAYLGTDFHGWQLQKSGVRTVQAEVEKALSIVANHPIRVFCCGRTDAGVHAIEQVIHFETDAPRPAKAWLFGGNVNLPADVSFVWVKPIEDNFHARFNAIARQYHYKIYNSRVRCAIKAKNSVQEPIKLDLKAMQMAGNILLGQHDFSAFRGSLCQAKSPVKTIEHLNFTQTGDDILLDIKATAFLHHMVRNIVGTLLKVGKGERDIAWVEQVLKSKQRQSAGATAPPHGLYFIKAFYPDL